MLNNCKPKLRVDCKTIIQKNIAKIQASETQFAIINQLWQLIDLLNVWHIGVYYPNQYEINILGLMELRTDLSFSLPKIIGQEMIYSKYNLGDKLTKNIFNIYESNDTTEIYPQLICLPGLGFSVTGYRLGYGKGYFDRYLMKHPTIFKVGICVREQLIPHFQLNNFDQKLHYIITDE